MITISKRSSTKSKPLENIKVVVVHNVAFESY